MRVLHITAVESGGVTRVEATLAPPNTHDVRDVNGYRISLLVNGGFVPPLVESNHRNMAEALANVMAYLNSEIHCEHESNPWCIAVHDGGVGTDIKQVIAPKI